MPWLSALVTWRLRRISTGEYVENLLRCALVKRLFEILNPGVDCFASILLEGAVDDAVGRVIISSDWCRWLWMS